MGRTASRTYSVYVHDANMNTPATAVFVYVDTKTSQHTAVVLSQHVCHCALLSSQCDGVTFLGGDSVADMKERTAQLPFQSWWHIHRTREDCASTAQDLVTRPVVT